MEFSDCRLTKLRFGQRRALAGDPGLSDEAARREAVPGEYPGTDLLFDHHRPFPRSRLSYKHPR